MNRAFGRLHEGGNMRASKLLLELTVYYLIIGVALFIDHEISHDEILKRADAAMYLAKVAGRNSIRFYAAAA